MEERLGEPSSHARIGRWRRSSAESLWRAISSLVRANQCGKGEEDQRSEHIGRSLQCNANSHYATKEFTFKCRRCTVKYWYSINMW